MADQDFTNDHNFNKVISNETKKNPEKDPINNDLLTSGSGIDQASVKSNLESLPSNSDPAISTNTGGATANQVNKVLSLAIKDLKVLYAAYMSFVIDGGLFIPTRKNFNMGDQLPLIITLIEDVTKYTVNSKVIWITPNNVNNRNPGIGVQFIGNNARDLWIKINSLLKNVQSNNITNTM